MESDFEIIIDSNIFSSDIDDVEAIDVTDEIEEENEFGY